MICSHGYATPAACIDCMDDDGLGAAPVPPERFVRFITAQFDSQCPACDLPIQEGQQIGLTTSERWIHQWCA